MTTEIRRAAFLSNLIYHPEKYISLNLPEWVQFWRFIENDATDTQAGVFVTENEVYVVFRGTEFDNLEDWYTNLDFALLGWSLGGVHRGFYKDVTSVYFPLIEELMYHNLKTPEKKTIITGHSQGGGDAQVFFALGHHSYDMLVTFGAPRVFDNEAVANLIGAAPKVVRVVNNNDIVTRLPPRLIGYRHLSGSLWYFAEDGDLWHHLSKWEEFKDRVKGRVNDLFELGTDGVKDHDRVGYLRLVEEA